MAGKGLLRDPLPKSLTHWRTSGAPPGPARPAPPSHPLRDQLHRLKLELPRELPSLHDTPPGSIKTPNSVSSKPAAALTSKHPEAASSVFIQSQYRGGERQASSEGTWTYLGLMAPLPILSVSCRGVWLNYSLGQLRIHLRPGMSGTMKADRRIGV